ncbi:hypothetical protein [Streptococcus suis]|nr:hypothetical protein [Streptococcus suis]HEM3171373.1 hypothetical protein [Streptococcus suis]HEM6509329.1 hypothetical protein [Streptococcus suis]
MAWVVQVPVKKRGGVIAQKKHEFKTKTEAKRFQSKLDGYSEIYKVNYLR